MRATLGIVCLLAGCTALPPRTCPSPPVLPLVQRGPIEPEVTPASSPSPGRAELVQGVYRGLSATECQCLAVHATATANVLESDSTLSGGHHERTELYQTMIHYTADELRNRSAGAALEAYFRLAEAEGRTDLLRESLAETGTLLARSEEMSAKGLRPQAETETLRRQRSQLRSDEIELRLGIEQLDGQLKSLLGLSPSPCEDYRLWPTTSLVVAADCIDVNACIDFALTHRAELQLLRVLLKDLNRRTLPVARLVLGSVNGMLSGPARPSVSVEIIVKVWMCLNGDEVEAVRQQLQTLLDDRERQVIREVVEAAHMAEGRRQQVELAHQRQKIDQKKVDDLQEQADKGGSVQAELSQARLDAIKSRGELLSGAVNWEIASVRLKQAQGLLVLECRDSCACPSAAMSARP